MKKKKKEKKFLKKSKKPKSMPSVIFRRDHLRFGIICGPIWGSFPVWGSFAVGDHLRRCTTVSSKILFARAKIWMQIILIAAILVRPPYTLTALDLLSEDYESKSYKPLVEDPCCSPSHRCFIDSFTNWCLAEKWSHQNGRRKFLGSRNEGVTKTIVMRMRPQAPKTQTPQNLNSFQFISPKKFYGHAMFMGNSHNRLRYLSFPVYRCPVD